MKTIFEEMGGTYRQVGYYFIPNITSVSYTHLDVYKRQRLPWAEYQLDILLQGDSYERGEIVGELTENGYIRKLQARLREERYHEQPCMDR